MACSGISCTRSSCWKPSHYHWDFLHYQTVFCSGLLPKGQNCTHLVYYTWPDLHSGDQLDFDDVMFGCYYWFQKHKTHKQCSRYFLGWSLFPYNYEGIAQVVLLFPFLVSPFRVLLVGSNQWIEIKSLPPIGSILQTKSP